MTDKVSLRLGVSWGGTNAIAAQQARFIGNRNNGHGDQVGCCGFGGVGSAHGDRVELSCFEPLFVVALNRVVWRMLLFYEKLLPRNISEVGKGNYTMTKSKSLTYALLVVKNSRL